jgi:hypothetical protein
MADETGNRTDGDDAGGSKGDAGYDPTDDGAPALLSDLLDGAVRGIQLTVFLALVFTPLLAGFLVPVGAPAYRVELAAVTTIDNGPTVEGPTRTYADLDDPSQATFDDLLTDRDNVLTVRTADPNFLFEPGDRTVTRDGLAYRVTAERRGLRRFGAILGGVLISTLTTVAGAVTLGWDPLGPP